MVVQDRETYIVEALRQLNNPMFYLKVDEDLTPKHKDEVLNYIDRMYEEGELDITVVNYLHEQETKTARFYLLPKIQIHKGILPPLRNSAKFFFINLITAGGGGEANY